MIFNRWEGVNLLPFIDEARLLDALEKHAPDETLTDDERRRNTFGHEWLIKYDAEHHLYNIQCSDSYLH